MNRFQNYFLVRNSVWFCFCKFFFRVGRRLCYILFIWELSDFNKYVYFGKLVFLEELSFGVEVFIFSLSLMQWLVYGVFFYSEDGGFGVDKFISYGRGFGIQQYIVGIIGFG